MAALSSNQQNTNFPLPVPYTFKTSPKKTPAVMNVPSLMKMDERPHLAYSPFGKYPNLFLKINVIEDTRLMEIDERIKYKINEQLTHHQDVNGDPFSIHYLY